MKKHPLLKYWFNTLNEALESELLTELWPLGTNINYGETVRIHVEDGNKIRMISVYRNDEGLYERPTHYLTS